MAKIEAFFDSGKQMGDLMKHPSFVMMTKDEYGNLYPVFRDDYDTGLGHKLSFKQPSFVMVLKQENGSFMPVIEGYNEVDPGKYQVYMYFPNNMEENRLLAVGELTISIDDELKIIVFSQSLNAWSITDFESESSKNEKLERWEEEKKEKGARIARYRGWHLISSIGMANSAYVSCNSRK